MHNRELPMLVSEMEAMTWMFLLGWAGSYLFVMSCACTSFVGGSCRLAVLCDAEGYRYALCMFVNERVCNLAQIKWRLFAVGNCHKECCVSCVSHRLVCNVASLCGQIISLQDRDCGVSLLASPDYLKTFLGPGARKMLDFKFTASTTRVLPLLNS